jgi:hypothetical protein
MNNDIKVYSACYLTIFPENSHFPERCYLSIA